MKYIYSIYDNVAEYYLPPFVANNDQEAKRMFIQSMDRNYAHRGDFTLGKVAHWDDQTGHFEPSDWKSILNGLSIPDGVFQPHPNQIPMALDEESQNPSKELQS